MIDLNEKPLCTIPRVMCWAVDNLELLKSQPNESVNMIYCDILYGTGRNFGDYQDLKPIRLGSGTTAVVCKELNRNFIGCDINPKAIEITKSRLNSGQ